MHKILILGNSKLTVFGFRGELIKNLITNNFNVTTVFPIGPFGEGENIAKKYSCKFIEISMNRRGTNPISDLKLLFDYIKILKKEKPDLVLAFTVKCDIYGGIASKILKIPFIPNITGIGKGLTEGKITKFITKKLYQISINRSKCVFFQNNSDYNFFCDNNIKFKNGIILPGSGVNLEKYKVLEYPKSNKIKFLYISRLMKTKGINEYIEAARAIMSKRKNIEFHICGYCEENYKDIIKDEQEKGIIIYHGLVDDVIKYEKECHCVILPTFHPEGVSNVLLEAAACARPIITTNRVGSQETIIDKKTGFLINERDSKDLIEKIELFLQLSYFEKRQMGLEGRKHIEKNFNRNIVIEQYMKIIKEVLGD